MAHHQSCFSPNEEGDPGGGGQCSFWQIDGILNIFAAPGICIAAFALGRNRWRCPKNSRIRAFSRPEGLVKGGLISLSIVMVSDDFRPGDTGVGVYLQRVAPELVRCGHRVAVITSRRSGQASVEQWNGVTVHRVFSVPILGFFQALPSGAVLRRIFEQVKPDLIHHHYTGLMMLQVSRLARSLGLPQLVTHHFSPDVLTQAFFLRPFRQVIWRALVRHHNRCQLVIVPSPRVAEELGARGIRIPLRSIPNVLRYGDIHAVTAAARPPGFTVLYAGRLGVEKNIPYLFRALVELIRTVPDVTVWIAGRGPDEASLKSLCQAMGLARHVVFLGMLDEATLARHYKACDVFVLPSLKEVQPLVVLEAMWFGRPVIVTEAILAARELVDEGQNGFVVDPESPADLACRLRELAIDPTARLAMGEKGQQRASAFQPQAVVAALNEVYLEVIRSSQDA